MTPARFCAVTSSFIVTRGKRDEGTEGRYGSFS
jgi:hypothetical protein